MIRKYRPPKIEEPEEPCEEEESQQQLYMQTIKETTNPYSIENELVYS